MILQYLPLHQSFQIRRVSQQWNAILSTPKTVDAILKWWYPRPETEDSAYEGSDGYSPEVEACLKAERVDAFRTGRPFGKMTHDLDCFPEGLEARFVAYAGGVIAWIDSTSYRAGTPFWNNSCPFEFKR